MFYCIYIDKNPVYFTVSDANTLNHFGVIPEKCEGYCKNVLSVSETAITRYAMQYNSSRGYAESMNILYLTSNALLDQGYCSFHAAAVCVDGKGYLLTGESGVGKSTQYLNLKKLNPERIEIINGDKPFLHFGSDQRIMIHTSPWRGKEKLGSDIACELDSIIFLKQSQKNQFYQLDPVNAVMRSFKQFLYYADSEKTIRRVCELERKLLTSVPVFLYENTGDLSSSDLLYEKLLKNGAALYE